MGYSNSNTDFSIQTHDLYHAHVNDKEFVMTAFDKDIYHELSPLMWREWCDEELSLMQHVYKLWFMIGLMKQALCDESLDAYFYKKFTSMNVKELFPEAFEKYEEKQNELIADMLDSATEVTVEEE